MNAWRRYFDELGVAGLMAASLLILPALASAQTAELRGVVADATGAVLPGVSIRIQNAGTGVERAVTTDSDGLFRVPALQPGSYVVESILMGFNTDSRKLALTVGQVAELRIALTVGALEESVQVVGSSATVEIDTTTSDLSAVVTQQQLAELPVLNRGFVGLAQLLPGGGPARSGDGRSSAPRSAIRSPSAAPTCGACTPCRSTVA